MFSSVLNNNLLRTLKFWGQSKEGFYDSQREIIYLIAGKAGLKIVLYSLAIKTRVQKSDADIIARGV